LESDFPTILNRDIREETSFVELNSRLAQFPESEPRKARQLPGCATVACNRHGGASEFALANFNVCHRGLIISYHKLFIKLFIRIS